MKKIEFLFLTFLTLFFSLQIRATDNFLLTFWEYKKLSDTDKVIYIKNLNNHYYELETSNLENQKYKITFQELKNINQLIKLFLPESFADLDESFYNPKLACLIGGASVKKDKNEICNTSGRQCQIDNNQTKTGFKCGKIYRNICVEKTLDPKQISKLCHLNFNKALEEGKFKDFNENEYARFSHHLTHFDKTLCKDIKSDDPQFQSCILFRKRLSQTIYSMQNRNSKSCDKELVKGKKVTFVNDNKALFEDNKIESYVKSNQIFMNEYHSKKDTMDKLCNDPEKAEFQKNAVLLQDYNGSLYLPYGYEKNENDFKLVTNGEIKSSQSSFDTKNNTFSSFRWNYCGFKVIENPSCEEICRALRGHKSNQVAKNSVESCLNNSKDCFKIPFENLTENPNHSNVEANK